MVAEGVSLQRHCLFLSLIISPWFSRENTQTPKFIVTSYIDQEMGLSST
jgi:hypothetical protein